MLLHLSGKDIREQRGSPSSHEVTPQRGLLTISCTHNASLAGKPLPSLKNKTKQAIEIVGIGDLKFR